MSIESVALKKKVWSKKQERGDGATTSPVTTAGGGDSAAIAEKGGTGGRLAMEISTFNVFPRILYLYILTEYF